MHFCTESALCVKGLSFKPNHILNVCVTGQEGMECAMDSLQSMVKWNNRPNVLLSLPKALSLLRF